MKVRDLREGLALLSQLLSSWQAKAAASDLERLAQLLGRHDELSAAEFCSAVEKALSQGSQNAESSPRRKTDDATVQRWLEDLRQAENSPDRFELLMPKIEKMRNTDLFALANAYCGIQGNYRRKADAIKAIRETRTSDASARRQLKGISGIF